MFKSYNFHPNDIMGDRCHVVYALLVQGRSGRWVYVGQTKHYHDRVSEHKQKWVVISHCIIKGSLLRSEAVDLEQRLLAKGVSHSGLPVYGR